MLTIKYETFYKIKDHKSKNKKSNPHPITNEKASSYNSWFIMQNMNVGLVTQVLFDIKIPEKFNTIFFLGSNEGH